MQGALKPFGAGLFVCDRMGVILAFFRLKFTISPQAKEGTRL